MTAQRDVYLYRCINIAGSWRRKKKEGQSSNSSSSSSSSYDEGSEDAYSGDYDENRYDNDENYRDGVDDMLDELGE